jgi:hypothetical protein
MSIEAAAKAFVDHLMTKGIPADREALISLAEDVMTAHRVPFEAIDDLRHRAGELMRVRLNLPNFKQVMQ